MTDCRQRQDRSPLPSPRRVIVHVGQTKAGSTAIQNYLDAQRQALAAQGWLVPQTLFLRRNPFDRTRTPGHFGLITNLRDGDMTAFETELDASGCDNVVLSLESLFSDQPNDMLALIAAYFQDWQVEILAVLRAFPDWAASRYVEEVLSGYERGTLPMDAFMADLKANGVHDYAARLNQLHNTLGAVRTTPVNYNAAIADKGLLPTFLDRAGLPVTDPGLARNIQSNVRKKEWFLIEGKRRLNNAIVSLRAGLRLDLEARLLTQTKDIAATLSDPLTRFTSATLPMSTEICRAVARSNAVLKNDFAMVPLLPDPSPVPADPLQHRRSLPGADMVIERGIEEAAAISREAHYKLIRRPLGRNLLAVPGSPILIDVFRQSAVSLHLDSPDSAVWAACIGDRLSILCHSQSMPLEEIDRLLTARLPSPLICLDDLAQLPRLFPDDRPDIVIAPAELGHAQLKAALPLVAVGGQLVLFGCALGKAQDIGRRLKLWVRETHGAVHLLARPNGF